MGAKLVIWIDGCWRSLEELQEEGRVLKFAVLRDGHIKMLSRPPKVSSVVVGKPLRYRAVKRRNKASHEKENIGNNNISCQKEKIGNEKETNHNTSTEQENIRINIMAGEKENFTNEKESFRNHKMEIEKENIRNNIISVEKENVRNAEKEKISDKNNKISDERKIEEVKKKYTTAKNVCNDGKNVDSSVESMSSSHSEELVIEIDEKDILMMRKFFFKTRIYKVDVNRFDKDKVYRQVTLYRFQPVVQVDRLLPRLHHQLTPSLRSNSRASFQIKTASIAAKSSGKISKPARRHSPVKIRKSSVPAGREYSSLEDHAIVSWLSASRQREHAVNGNRVWRELEQHHARLTGQERSWHSLRNRYLRYILPALSLLALSPSHAQRLRAAAATGEIKNRRKRRPSILHEPPVQTAHTRARLRPSLTLSDDSDGILHEKVRRPSIQPKKTNAPVKKPQEEKSKYQSGNTTDDAQTRGGRRSLRKSKSLLETSDESTTKKSKKNIQNSEIEKVKSSETVRQSKSREFSSRSPLKRIQMDKPKNWSEHSDTDEELPKKKAPKKPRDSEESDSEGENRERSRLRPRLQNLSDNSDDDNTYAPTSPQKKRRKLFNPFS